MKQKLYFENKYIGDIEQVESEMFRVEGNIELNEEGKKLNFFFNALIDEDFKRGKKKPNFDIEEYLFNSNWHIVDSNGERREIFAPVVYPNKTIYWKWK